MPTASSVYAELTRVLVLPHTSREGRLCLPLQQILPLTILPLTAGTFDSWGHLGVEGVWSRCGDRFKELEQLAVIGVNC